MKKASFKPGNTFRSFKPSAAPASPIGMQHPGPVRHVEGMTEKEEEEILALAESITKPANTGARRVRLKPSDLRSDLNSRSRRPYN